MAGTQVADQTPPPNGGPPKKPDDDEEDEEMEKESSFENKDEACCNNNELIQKQLNEVLSCLKEKYPNDPEIITMSQNLQLM